LIITAVPGTDVLVLTADVRDVESVRGAVKSVIQRFGKLDILITNLKCGHTFRIHAE
jgi:NAD(P)-dependent dehydrogenase (short-subunit alcohol dehydrogenase family)